MGGKISKALITTDNDKELGDAFKALQEALSDDAGDNKEVANVLGSMIQSVDEQQTESYALAANIIARKAYFDTQDNDVPMDDMMINTIILIVSASILFVLLVGCLVSKCTGSCCWTNKTE